MTDSQTDHMLNTKLIRCYSQAWLLGGLKINSLWQMLHWFMKTFLVVWQGVPLTDSNKSSSQFWNWKQLLKPREMRDELSWSSRQNLPLLGKYTETSTASLWSVRFPLTVWIVNTDWGHHRHRGSINCYHALLMRLSCPCHYPRERLWIQTTKVNILLKDSVD